MNSNHNDLCQTKYLMSSQEKLEWVAPAISLLKANDAEGKISSLKEGTFPTITVGPS